jgi:hypothetical protein
LVYILEPGVPQALREAAPEVTTVHAHLVPYRDARRTAEAGAARRTLGGTAR